MSELYHTAQQLPLLVLSKTCRTCGVEKPIECFQKHKGFRDGHTIHCKKCLNVQGRAKYDPEKDKQRRLRKGPTKWRAANNKHYANNRERIAAKERERYANDETMRERKRAQGQKRLIERGDEMRAYGRAHYRANISFYKEKDMRRNALKRQVPVEKVSYKQILDQHGRWCHICQQPILPHQKLEFDHVIPITRNGPHTAANIRPSHKFCNKRKGNRLMEELTDWHRVGPPN